MQNIFSDLQCLCKQKEIWEVVWVSLFLESNLISAQHTEFLLYHKCSYRKEFGLALL